MLLSEFLIKKEKNHKNINYDFSKLPNEFKSRDIVIIGCPNKEHGFFPKQVGAFLHGQGCPKCGIEKRTNDQRMGTEEFIKRSIKIWGNDIWDYSKVEYIDSYKPVIIIEKSTNIEWFQYPRNHLLGHKPLYKKDNYGNRFMTTEEFIEKARKIHTETNQWGNPRYEYHKVEYIDSKTDVWIHCTQEDENGLVHGDFPQTPNAHLNGKGCPICANHFSKIEKEIVKYIETIYSNNIDENKYYENIGELDIYLPDKKLAFEINGLYWHNELFRNSGEHIGKTINSEKQGIQLIHIFEDEWLYKSNIIKSRIKNLLGLSEKIYARKCEIKVINSNIEKIFLENNHIQGYTPSLFCYGLFYNNELFSIMSFGKLRINLGQKESKDGEYELLRFCNKIGYSVIGGASKLFKYFVSRQFPKKIISYADRRFSTTIKGKNLYENLGFKFIGSTPQNYFYIIGHERKNRFNFRKDILISKYGCPPEMTEHEFCKNKKWYRIYDCGNLKYEWIK